MNKMIICSVLSTALFSGCAFTDKIQSGLDAYDTAKTLVSSQPVEHHTVIVAGYGTPVKGNPTYQNYIKGVADYVENETNGVDSVVFSGAYTNNPDLSEAESMNSYFNSQVDTNTLSSRGVKVYKEDCAIVSWQNISLSQELLKTQDIAPSQVTIFGDIYRADKLKTFAAYKFNLDEGIPKDLTQLVNKSLNTASVDYQGFDFGAAADSDEVRNAKFGAEILGAYDPALGNEILNKRLAEWSVEYEYDVADNLVAKGCIEYKGF